MFSGVEHYLEHAESALQGNDLEEFLRFLGNAEAVASNTEIMARIFCLRAKGLYLLRRYESALKAIEEALKFPQSEKNQIRLKKSKACVLTYTGKYKESLQLLKQLTTETDEGLLLTEVYQNIAWTLLESYKANSSDAILEEAKLYLDLAFKAIEDLDSRENQRIILANYAEYFKLKGENDMAIEMLEEGLQYRSESQLPKAYNDLAEVYMQRNEKGDLELVEKYLHDAEILATKYDNELEQAFTLYLRGLLKMNSNDFVQVMDCMYIAYNNFVSVGALNYAMDCYNKICEVSEKMKSEFVSSVKDKLIKQIKEKSYHEVI